MITANALLAHIEPSVWDEVQDRFSLQTLKRGDVIQRPGEEITYVYFPTTAVIALGADTLAGEGVNVTLLGREGALGVFEACGSRHAFTRATAQVPGSVLRLSAGHYRQLFEASSGLRGAIHKYIEVLLAEARQFVACNALHSVEQRLARTLLELQDKTDSEPLPLTQDALSQILGVQRTTVAASVSGLQRQGVIRTVRGGLSVVSHDRLETAACSCRETLSYIRDDIYSRVSEVCEA